MARLHLFNPDNDLALANGLPTFTPPRSALGLRFAGAALPMWYGSPDDYFVGAVNDRWFTEISETFGLRVEPTQVYESELQPTPWGWSAVSRRLFLDIGTPEDRLPDMSRIDLWRNLSHRATSADIARRYYEITGSRLQSPVIAEDFEAAVNAVRQFGRAMLKLPWSNAGRGQQDTGRIPESVTHDRIRGMLNRQQSIEIEPYYNRIADFAVLFDEKFDYVGLSLFTTDTHGGWTGNLLMSDVEIARRLGIDAASIAEALAPLISGTARDFGYHGQVGVDMMVAETETGERVVPLVEVNWRRTMGHVAHAFAERFLLPDVKATLTVEQRSGKPYKSLDSADIKNGRLRGGALDLVPSGGDFRIITSVC